MGYYKAFDECEHPEDCIEWGDDDERGECTMCGGTCDWHYEMAVVDEGHDTSGAYFAREGRIRVADVWHPYE